jgi:peptidyl-prolyl cis-trans isomerase C
VLKLNEGELSGPTQSKYGYHVMKVTRIVAAQALSFAEAKKDLEKRLLEQKQRDARMLWVKQLRAAATVKFNAKNIREFVKQSQKDAEAKPVGPNHGQAKPPGH